MRIFLLNQVPTMTVSRWPCRNVPRPEKGAAICTRLILSAVFSAVKKYEFQRGSVRTICCCKCPNGTATGKGDPPCLQFLSMPLPGRQTILTCLPKSMVIAVPTHPRQSSKQTYNSNKKADAAKKGCIRLSIIWIYICPFPAGS